MTESKLVTYYNSGIIPLIKAADLPYTDVILAFITTSVSNPITLQLSGAIAATTTSLTQGTIDAIKSMQENGKKVLISFGGETMGSDTYKQIVGKEDSLAKSLSEFIKNNHLDGIDIDWEDTAAFMGNAGYNGVDFLVNLTKSLRKYLPKTEYIITHAPQPPYLEKGSGMDGYINVMEQAGSDIDWLNVQYYNNPPWSANPQQIVDSYRKYCQLTGLSADKLLIGLPVTSQDAGSGYVQIPDIINNIIKPIRSTQTLGGMMNWQFSSDKNGNWATQIGEAMSLSVKQTI